MSGAKNQVTLTFAGDSDQLERAFDKVGASAKSMGRQVTESAGAFDKANEVADSAENKFQGVSSTISGTKDSLEGFSMMAKGDFIGGLAVAGGGLADLAEGFAYTLIPLAKTVATTAASTAANVAHATSTFAVSAATKVWTGVQWLLNAALLANPIVLIVAGIILLIGVIVLIATKTTWFQDIWRVVWTNVKKWALAFWDWLKDLPGQIATVFGKMASFITAPWRTAFNFIASAWNNTIGKLKWTVPSWVPIIGGNTISAPQLPKFHAGGVVPGAPGTEMLALLQAGERVSPTGSGGAMVLEVRSGGSRLDDLLVEILSRAISLRGGDVQLVLGGSRG